MKKSIMEKWVAALRSGDYYQGSHQLRNEMNEFCCLGVLCNLHAMEHPWSAATQTNPTEYLGRYDTPNYKVLEWAGMDSRNELGEFKNGLCLTEMNDEGMTFNEIADVIEKKYREL